MSKIKNEYKRTSILRDAPFLVSLVLLLMTIPSYILSRYVIWYGSSYKVIPLSFVMGTSVILFCIFITGFTREMRKSLIKGLDVIIVEDDGIKLKITGKLADDDHLHRTDIKKSVSGNSVENIDTGYFFVKIETDRFGDLLVPRFLINSETELEELRVINKI